MAFTDVYLLSLWLSYPESAGYPFPFQIGERLRSISKNIDGVVRNALYSGPEDPSLGYYILYYIVTDEDVFYKIPLDDLEKITIH